MMDRDRMRKTVVIVLITLLVAALVLPAILSGSGGF